jgi:hypothetical protein
MVEPTPPAAARRSSLTMLMDQFRQRYPNGALMSELLTLHQGDYVVRVSIQMGTMVLATSMAAAPTVEQAEDLAMERVLRLVGCGAVWTGGSPTFPGGLSQGVAAIPKPGVGMGLDTAESRVTLEPPDPITAPSNLPKTTPTVPITPTSKTSVSSEPTPPPLTEAQSDASAEGLLLLDTTVSPLSAESSAEDSSAPKKSKPTKATKSSEPKSETPADPTQDVSDLIAKIDVEMMRLGWNASKGREHLKSTYGKRSRQQLSYPELLDFLTYLEAQA